MLLLFLSCDLLGDQLSQNVLGALKMREWKMQEWKLQEKTAEVEIAGVEKAGVDRTGGKCRSGKYGSENVWKTVRTENKNSIN